MLHDVRAFLLAQAAHDHRDVRLAPHAAHGDDAGCTAGNVGHAGASGGGTALNHAVNAVFRKNLVAGPQSTHHPCRDGGSDHAGGAVQHSVVVVILVGARTAHEPLGGVQVQVHDPVEAQFFQVRLIDFQERRADNHLQGLFRRLGRHQLLQHAQVLGRAVEKEGGVARVVFDEAAFREFHAQGGQRLLRVHPFQGHAGRTGIPGTEGIGIFRIGGFRQAGEETRRKGNGLGHHVGGAVRTGYQLRAKGVRAQNEAGSARHVFQGVAERHVLKIKRNSLAGGLLG